MAVFENPPVMLMISSMMGVAVYPALGLGTLYLRYRKVDSRIHPTRLTTSCVMGLWIGTGCDISHCCIVRMGHQKRMDRFRDRMMELSVGPSRELVTSVWAYRFDESADTIQRNREHRNLIPEPSIQGCVTPLENSELTNDTVLQRLDKPAHCRLVHHE
jgi:hypothetical protein